MCSYLNDARAETSRQGTDEQEIHCRARRYSYSGIRQPSRCPSPESTDPTRTVTGWLPRRAAAASCWAHPRSPEAPPHTGVRQDEVTVVTRASHRIALAACAAFVLAASLGVVWYLLPGPKGCAGLGRLSRSRRGEVGGVIGEARASSATASSPAFDDSTRCLMDSRNRVYGDGMRKIAYLAVAI